MFLSRFTRILTAVSFLFIAAPAHAAPEKYEFDTVHSQIIFFVSHLGFSISEGEFLDFDGHYIFDKEDPAASSVEVTIDTASIDMDDEKWDAHLKNQDFFDVEKFPSMTFKSTKIEVTGDKTADIHGDLTILDVTKPVVLKTNMVGEGVHPYSGKSVTGFSARTTIKRSEFGMKYGLPGIGDDVEIRIEIEGHKVAEAAK